MKHIIQYALILSLLTLVACGKNKSGGQNSQISNQLNISTSQLSASSTTALNNFVAWYNNPIENYPIGTYRLSYVTSGANNSNCELKDIKVFGTVIGQYYVCSGGTTGGGTTTECSVVVHASNSNVNIKPNNSILAMIANGQAGTLIQAIQQNTVISLQFQKQDGSVVSYMIDTQLHSSMQPVQITNSSTGTFEYLSSGYQFPQTITGIPACN